MATTASALPTDTYVSGFGNAAVLVEPTSGSPAVTLDGVDIRNGCAQAVKANRGTGTAASVTINNSTITGSQVGIESGAGGTVSVTNSVLYANRTATLSTGGAIDTSSTTNQIVGNDVTALPGGASWISGATRTWVSTAGNDANPCSRTAPCRTFAAAIGKTVATGEINVVGNGDYGPVTISKPITIDGTGASATITAPIGGAGIIVNAAAAQDVILRNLTINSAFDGSLGCPYRSTYGVRVLGGRVVNIENVTISGSATAGITVNPASSRTRVLVNGGSVQHSCGAAISNAPGSGDSTIFVRKATIGNSQVGITAGAGSHIWVAGSTLINNQLALQPAGGLLDTWYGTNTFVGNVANGTPSSEIGAPVPPAAVPPAPVRQAPGVGCVVLPKKLKRNSTIKWQKKICKTNAGEKIKFSIKGKGKLVRGSKGKISIKTGRKGKLTLVMSAPATATHAAYRVTRTYTLK